MAAGDKVSILRGQEATVQVHLQARSQVDGSLAEVDLSGSPALTWRAVSDLGDTPTNWITKTSAAGEISVITNGTGGTDAVIQFSLSEADTATVRDGFWVCWSVKGAVTTPYRPGRFSVEAYPTL